MKRFKYIITILIFLLLVNGCEKDFLDVNDPNNLSPKTFWQNEEDAIKAITATYALFQYQVWNGRWGFFEIGYMNFECRSDLIALYDMWAPFGNMSRYNADPSSYVLHDFWSFTYQGLYAANQVIENISRINANQEIKNTIKAEAKFLRAYAHYLLFINFKNIIIKTATPKSSSDYYLPQSGEEEVWAIIEKDLKEAKQNLPPSWESQWYGRATKGAASTLLAKAFLWQEKWGEAKNELQEIVSSGQYKLISDYESLFTGLNEHSKESIFEINFTMNDDGGRNERNSFPAMQTDWKMSTPNEFMRKLYLQDTTSDGNLSKRVKGSVIFNNLSTDNLNALAWKKYSYYDEKTSNGLSFSNSGTNLVVFRYADVLLMLAETLNELGETNSAIEYVNKVRARAEVGEIKNLNQTELREHIRHIERPLELASETGRYYDLVRWYRKGNLRSILSKHNREGAESFDNANDLYYPIPTDELTANPNLKQNAGY